jgi:hypothetical protein
MVSIACSGDVSLPLHVLWLLKICDVSLPLHVPWLFKI